MNPNDAGSILDAIRRRRSIRAFTSDPVPDDVIRELAEAALAAPTGGNKRMCRLVAVRQPDTLSAMRDAVSSAIAALRQHVTSPRAQQQFDGYASHFTHFAGAPCVIAVLAKPYDSIYQRIVSKYVPPESAPRQDLVDVSSMSVAAAVENLLLAASALGYGACFMTGPLVAQREIERLLAVEGPWHVAALVPVGRPASGPQDRPAQPLGDFLDLR